MLHRPILKLLVMTWPLSAHTGKPGRRSRLNESVLFPRFALRFTSLDHIDKFCKEKKLDNNARLGSWKVTGVHASIGQHGALAFLVAQQWQDVEVLYLKEDQMVFLSANCGNCALCGTSMRAPSGKSNSRLPTRQPKILRSPTACPLEFKLLRYSNLRKSARRHSLTKFFLLRLEPRQPLRLSRAWLLMPKTRELPSIRPDLRLIRRKFDLMASLILMMNSSNT